MWNLGQFTSTALTVVEEFIMGTLHCDTLWFYCVNTSSTQNDSDHISELFHNNFCGKIKFPKFTQKFTPEVYFR